MRRLPLRIAYAPRGPLWHGEGDLSEFLSLLSANLRRSGVVHLKVNPSGHPDAPAALQRLGFVRVVRPRSTFAGILPELTARVALAGGAEAVRAAMEPDARRRVRQAERRGVEITRHDAASGIDGLYHWLQSTAERQRFYLPPKSALRAMAASWLDRDEGLILLARHDGACIGGALCSFFGAEAAGHFLADDPDRRHLSAVYALYAAGVDEGVRRNCRFFDFGGIRDGRDDPLYRFKRQFGAAPEPHAGEWNLPLRPALYRSLSLLSRGTFAERI